MKPENFLQIDLLDIIFLNRNKDYGAYLLRKTYDARLIKSFLIVLMLAVCFVAVTYINSNYNAELKTLTPILVNDVEFIKQVQPKPKETSKPTMKSVRPVAQKIYVVPKIVKDDIADQPMSAIEDLEKTAISNVETTGEELGTGELQVAVTTGGDDQGVQPVPPMDPVEVEMPLNRAEVMPEFPGGMEAFKKFMMRNLRQPNLSEGEKVVVKVQFVVDIDGAIRQANVIQSGGYLDSEVLRVVGKMPKWKPGFQNGRFVSVYFTLPVTFLGPEI